MTRSKDILASFINIMKTSLDIAKLYILNNPLKSIVINKNIALPKSIFIDKQFIYYIKHNIRYCLETTIICNNKSIHIQFFSNREISQKFMQNAIAWFYFSTLWLKSSCKKPLVCKIYLTPFKKILDSNILGHKSVNSGLTMCDCSSSTEITIFRQEEWLKVLMHETFHNFNLDFCNLNLSFIKSTFTSLFNINSTFLIYESYCETWAIILYNVWYCANHPEQKIDYLLRKERLHSLKKTKLILYNMGLTYQDLINNNNTHRYKERTNVFCYYILKMLLLYNYPRFILWCDQHNRKVLEFKKTKKNLLLFSQYIETIYNDPDLLSDLIEIKATGKSLKMSALISKH